MSICRAFIDQPSRLQPLYHLDRKKCIVNDTKEEIVDVYFTEGKVHSMRIPRICITKLKLSSAENG